MKKMFLVLLGAVIVLWTISLYVKYLDGNDNIQLDKISQSTSSVKEYPQIDFLAPNFELLGLDGKKYSLNKMTGKPLVINFWASWCPPCRQEAPELVELYNQYQGKLEVLAINLTFQDTFKDVQTFVDEFGFAFPVLLDQEGTVAMSYQIQGIPTTFFVNEEGLIVDQVVGYSGPEILASKFAKLAAP